MMNFALKMMGFFAFKMMEFALKMMNFVGCARADAAHVDDCV